MGKSYTPAPQDPDFERWWEHYPRKVNKGEARAAWWQTRGIRPSTDLLIKCLIVAKASEDWLESGGRYIPHGATYLRSEKWEDAPQVEIDGVKDGKVWWQSVAGVEEKAKEVGVEWDTTKETFQQFTKRVKAAVDSFRNVPTMKAV